MREKYFKILEAAADFIKRVAEILIEK